MEEVLTPREALRELLHDASEGLLGWDPIGPLKDHLGEPFRQLEQRLQALVGERYALPAWDAAAYRRHKAADRLAAASEACHVVGWSREDMRNALGIVCEPSRTTLFRGPGSNRGSLGRRGSPSQCSCTGSTTFKPNPPCTKARSRDYAGPYEYLPDVTEGRDDWAEWEAMMASPSTDIVPNAWETLAGRLTPAH